MVCRFIDFFSTFRRPIVVAVIDFVLITPLMFGGLYYTMQGHQASAPYGMHYRFDQTALVSATLSAAVVMAINSYFSARRARREHLVRLPYRTVCMCLTAMVALTAFSLAIKVFVMHRDLTIYELGYSFFMFGLAGAPYGYRRLGFRPPMT